MAPNVTVSDVLDPTIVGDFQAETLAFEKPIAKKQRIVNVHTFTMEGKVPEKGFFLLFSSFLIPLFLSPFPLLFL